MLQQNVPFSALGHVTRGEMRVDDVSFGFLCDLLRDYTEAIEKEVS